MGLETGRPGRPGRPGQAPQCDVGTPSGIPAPKAGPARDRPVGDAEEDVASTEPPSCGALPQELEEVHHGAKVVHGGFF